ncbi:MAG: MBL fold metallo-hydrolase [Candidatus Thiodiazotropha sp.]
MKQPLRLSGLLMLTALLFTGFVSAADAVAPLKLHKVSDDIYAVVGPFGNRSPENLGNNATFGVVVTDEGVVLIDPGGSYQGAASIEAMIRQVTDKPVKLVINSGGQDHRWLGNGYFKQRGAKIIASAAADDDHRARLQDQMFVLGNLVGAEGMKGTDPVYADETFGDRMTLNFGGKTFELLKVGPAHTPGDSLVWLPQAGVVFSGDVVYVGRMLGVLAYSKSSHWIEAFETMAALEPKTVVPGHGAPTNLAHATRDTLDYLVFLRESVGGFMEEGGDITRIGSIDQERFSYLEDYTTLKGRNAQQVFQEMEWE